MNPVRNINATTLIVEWYYKLMVGYIGITTGRFLTG